MLSHLRRSSRIYAIRVEFFEFSRLIPTRFEESRRSDLQQDYQAVLVIRAYGLSAVVATGSVVSLISTFPRLALSADILLSLPTPL